MTPRHPAPPEVQAEWRALGAWTGETLLDRLAAVDPTTLAVVDGPTRLTVGDLREQSASVAAGLWDVGVRPGDVIAWQLPNWWEGVVLCWAAWRCGAIVSPITPSLRAREVGFILNQTGARVAVVPHAFRGTDYTALTARSRIHRRDHRGARRRSTPRFGRRPLPPSRSTSTTGP